MNTETDYLKSIAEEISQNKNTRQPLPNYHLAVEAKRLEKAIVDTLTTIENFTQRNTFYFNTLSKLVNICDILFAIDETITPGVELLLELLRNIGQAIPDGIRPNLKLPKAFIVLRQLSIAKDWQRHVDLMEQYGVDTKLIDIAAIPFKRFTEPKQILFWQDFMWLRDYQAKLDIIDWDNTDCNSNTEALISLLIGRDFNDDRFYIYCKKYIQERVSKVSGKSKRLLEYALCEKIVLEDTQLNVTSFDVRANSVSTRLIKLISEDIDFVETHQREQLQAKFEFKWSAEMIAFFFKLLHEHKVFGNITLERFSEVIAANCSSIDKKEFQASTIFSRFYKKDPELIKAVHKLLQEVVDDLGKFLR